MNAGNCHAINAITVNGASVCRQQPHFRIGEGVINLTTCMDPFKYLGHRVSGRGVEKPSVANLPVWVSNLKKAPLKPEQKLSIIKDFVIPKLLYGLQTPRVTKSLLKGADRIIKGYIKKSLHLNIHTPDCVLYAKVKDGELGLLELAGVVPNTFLRRISGLSSSPDPAVKAALESSKDVIKNFEKMAESTPTDQRWRAALIKCPYTKGLENAADDVVSRAWLSSKPKGWSGRDFVKAVQLRSNNLPVAGLPSNPVHLRGCRAGCQKQETISHVLQNCPATHFERIRRHNEVVHKIGFCLETCRVLKEDPETKQQEWKPLLSPEFLPPGVPLILFGNFKMTTVLVTS